MKGRTGVILIGLAWSLAMLRAEEPEWKGRLTRLPAGDFPIPESCELTYHLSWSNLLKAGEGRIVFFSRKPEGHSAEIYARAVVRSTGLARAIWPYDAKTESWVERETLLPIRDSQEEEDRNERNVYRTTFNRTNVINEWTTLDKHPGAKPEARTRTYAQMDPPIQDLMSGMLYLRSLPLRGLDKPLSVVCYPFRDPYLVTVKPLGKEPHEKLGRLVPALKFGVTLSKIERDLSLKVYDSKMTYAQFWVSDDALRLPLELKADIFVGSIRLTLKEYREPAPQFASGVSKPLVEDGKAGRDRWWIPGKRSRSTKATD
jgi:hypothetical protein